MARLFPQTFPAGSPRSEAIFYEACLQLDDTWVVMHSLPTLGQRSGLRLAVGQGEGDFLLLNQTLGILAVEVKGGDIEVTEGEWTSISLTGERNPIKNPFKQAADFALTVHKTLQIEFSNQGGSQVKLQGTVNHCVAFPSVNDGGGFSTYGPRQIVLYQSDLQNLHVALKRVASYYQQEPRWTPEEFKRIRKVLQPTRLLSGSGFEELVRCITELDGLTESQKRTIRQLTTGSGIHVITGGAGTGKTLLGMYRAELLAREGKKVLYLCSTPSLADHLGQEVPKPESQKGGLVRVDSAVRFINNLPRELKKSNSSASAEKSRADRFIDAIAELDLEGFYDCLILDEAQDIPRTDYELLELLIRKPDQGGMILIFGDPNQQLFLKRRDSALFMQENDSGYPNVIQHTLDVNCRNTREVAEVAHHFTNSDVSTLETRTGIKIDRHKYNGDLFKAVVDKSWELSDKYSSSNLVILTAEYQELDQLYKDKRQGTSSDPPLRSLLPPGATINNVHRYQGREADVVIAVLRRESLTRALPFTNFMKLVEPRFVGSRDRTLRDDLQKSLRNYRIFVEKAKAEGLDLESSLSKTRPIGKEAIERKVQQYLSNRTRAFVPNFSHPLLSGEWRRLQEQAWQVILYSMFTRARVVLSLVADKQTFAFVDQKTSALGDRDEYFSSDE